MDPLRFKTFVVELLKISERYCGKRFVQTYRGLIRRQKAKEQYLLRKMKQGLQVQPSDISYQNTIFDIFCAMYEKHLERDEYLRMSLEVGKISAKYGEFSKAMKMYRRVAQRAPKNHVLHAEALLREGDLQTKQNKFKEAHYSLKKSKEVYEQLRSNSGCAQVENRLAVNYCEQGRLGVGERHFAVAMEAAERARNYGLASGIAMNIGNVSSIRGKWADALAKYQEVLPHLERRGDAKRLALTCHNLGLTVMRQGRYQVAVSYFDKSLHFLRKLSDYYLTGLVYLGKAEAYVLMRDYMLAAGYAGKALEMFNRVGDGLSIADAYKVKGMIHREMKEWDVVELYFQTSLKINEEVGNALNTAETYYELGVLHKLIGNRGKAEESFQRAIEHYEKIQARQAIERVQHEIRIEA